MTSRFGRLQEQLHKKPPVWGIVIGILALLAMALVWPVGLIRDDYISRTEAEESQATDPIGLVMAFQTFEPQYAHLHSIGIDVGKYKGQAQEGTLYYHLYDQGLQLLETVSYPVADLKDGELTDIPVDFTLTPGARYYLGIQCEDFGQTAPCLHYRNKTRNAPVENIDFYYGPVVIPDATANIRYRYEVPLNPFQVLFYDSVILLLAACLYSLIGKVRKTESK